MRRLLALALACSLVPAAARAGGIGVGGFGGMSIPVLQDDTGRGRMFGLRVPVTAVPFVTVEPFYASSKLADKVTTVASLSYTRQGFDVTEYGANLMFAAGGPVSFYPILGAGKTRLQRDGYDQSFTTWSGGFGFAFSAVPKLSVHLRGELQAVVDGQTTRKFGNATAGLSYALFSVP